MNNVPQCEIGVGSNLLPGKRHNYMHVKATMNAHKLV
jgi:hypothetical protein